MMMHVMHVLVCVACVMRGVLGIQNYYSCNAALCLSNTLCNNYTLLLHNALHTNITLRRARYTRYTLC